MGYFNSQGRKHIAVYAAFALLPGMLLADPVTFSTATVQLDRYQVTIASKAKPEDFVAAITAMGRRDSWRVKLGDSTGTIKDVLVNVRLLTVVIEYDPGFLRFTNLTDIPKDQLKVSYIPTSQTLTVVTGKASSDAAVTLRKKNQCWNMALTDDKKSPDIDISGGWQAGVGASPQYFWNVKASCPFDLGEGEKYGRLGPSFTGQAGSQDKPQGNADPNSLKAGLTWNDTEPVRNSRNGFLYSADLISYEFEATAKKEAVLTASGKPALRNYIEKDSNLVWDGMARYSYNKINRPGVSWTLGFAGLEAGRSLTRTVHKTSQSTDNQAIARLMFSLDLYKVFRSGDRTFLTLHGQQILRLPFVPEPYQDASINDGNKFLTDKPRHWSEIEADWALAKGAGISLTYKRGTLPPGFEFVDHQITLGFSVQLKH